MEYHEYLLSRWKHEGVHYLMMRRRRYFSDDVDADVGVLEECLSSHVVDAVDVNAENAVGVIDDGRADFGGGGGAEDPALFRCHTSYLLMIELNCGCNRVEFQPEKYIGLNIN